MNNYFEACMNYITMRRKLKMNSKSFNKLLLEVKQESLNELGKLYI